MKAKCSTILVFAAIPGLVLLAAPFARADDDDHERSARLAAGAGTELHARYKSECGACHTAYAPGLLPADDWRAIMGRLDNHYGDNAELAPELRAEITRYLTGNAARGRPTFGAMREAGADLLPRITEQRWFRREHREIPGRAVTGNEEVRSFANCTACHRHAERGDFDEDSVRIPGYGRWED